MQVFVDAVGAFYTKHFTIYIQESMSKPQNFVPLILQIFNAVNISYLLQKGMRPLSLNSSSCQQVTINQTNISCTISKSRDMSSSGPLTVCLGAFYSTNCHTAYILRIKFLVLLTAKFVVVEIIYKSTEKPLHIIIQPLKNMYIELYCCK